MTSDELFAEHRLTVATALNEDSAHGHCAQWLRLFVHKHGRDPCPQEVWDAATAKLGSLRAALQAVSDAEANDEAGLDFALVEQVRAALRPNDLPVSRRP